MSRIVLLDGGMGQELIHRSAHPPSPLWSAKVLMDEPEIVEAVHRDYIRAGAKVLTLNTYSATPERLARDASEDLFKPLQAKAIEVGQNAISGGGDEGGNGAGSGGGDATTDDIVVAGCLPPLFGSYRPESAPSFEICLETYRRVVAEQAKAVDVFICETMSSVKEVEAAVQAAVESGKPVWCGMSAMDEDGSLLRSGESVAAGAAAAKAVGASAVLINCSWPEAVTQALPILAETGLPYGGYANGFTKADELVLGGTVDGLKTRTDLGPDQYADHAMGWVEAGATIVGGCCEVGPAHIQKLAERLDQAGHQITGKL